MAHFQVDDDLAFHHKTLIAGNAAMGLWVRAGSQCQRLLTDGFVSEDMAKTLGTQREVNRLLISRLWHKTDGGYVFHEWGEDVRTGLKRQETAEQNLKRRKDKAARMQRYRDGRASRRGQERDLLPEPPDDY